MPTNSLLGKQKWRAQPALHPQEFRPDRVADQQSAARQPQAARDILQQTKLDQSRQRFAA